MTQDGIAKETDVSILRTAVRHVVNVLDSLLNKVSFATVPIGTLSYVMFYVLQLITAIYLTFQRTLLIHILSCFSVTFHGSSALGGE